MSYIIKLTEFADEILVDIISLEQLLLQSNAVIVATKKSYIVTTRDMMIATGANYLQREIVRIAVNSSKQLILSIASEKIIKDNAYLLGIKLLKLALASII